eukprot:gene5428-10882_t
MLQKLTTLVGHTEDRVWHASWAPNGKCIASSGEDKIVRIWASKSDSWEGDSVRCIATLEDAQSRTIRCCEWSVDGSSIACASFDGTIAIWETQNVSNTSWELVATLEGHENEVKSVAWSPDGRWLASCGRDKTVWIWEKIDRREYECVALLQGKHGHSQDVKSVRWHPNLPILFSVSYDDSIKVWKEDVGDWYCAKTLTGHSSTVWALAIDPSGERLLTASDDKNVLLWQTENMKEGCNWNIIGTYKDVHKYAVYSIDWSQYNGHIVSGGGDNAVVLFNANQSEDNLIHIESRIENAHSGDVNCVRWNPSVLNSDLMVSAGDDGLLCVWRL